MRRVLTRQFAELLSNEESEGLVRDFHRTGFVRWSDTLIPFKSGRASHVYVGGRNDLTQNPTVLRKLGSLLAEAAYLMVPPDDSRNVCLIGIPVAGTALTVAASLASDTPFLVMRQVRKTQHGIHGTWVDGTPDPENYRYIAIDNTITDGGSKFETVEKLKEDGFPSKEVMHLIVVDRDIGGARKLAEHNIQMKSLFSLTEIIRAYQELGLWTPAQVEAIEAEIERDRMT